MIDELGMIRRYGLRRIWHLIRPGRRERERAAQRCVAEAATRLVDTPLGGVGLSLRRASQLPPDLRSDVFIGLMTGSIRLAPDDLDRLCSDPASVRAEYPQLFWA